jgi:uncharacterized membrane protein YukC
MYIVYYGIKNKKPPRFLDGSDFFKYYSSTILAFGANFLTEVIADKQLLF